MVLGLLYVELEVGVELHLVQRALAVAVGVVGRPRVDINRFIERLAQRVRQGAELEGCVDLIGRI